MEINLDQRLEKKNAYYILLKVEGTILLFKKLMRSNKEASSSLPSHLPMLNVFSG